MSDYLDDMLDSIEEAIENVGPQHNNFVVRQHIKEDLIAWNPNIPVEVIEKCVLAMQVDIDSNLPIIQRNRFVTVIVRGFIKGVELMHKEVVPHLSVEEVMLAMAPTVNMKFS
jgi:predicted transcriptional regulator